LGAAGGVVPSFEGSVGDHAGYAPEGVPECGEVEVGSVRDGGERARERPGNRCRVGSGNSFSGGVEGVSALAPAAADQVRCFADYFLPVYAVGLLSLSVDVESATRDGWG
jgi:hypothetical protein